MIITSKTNNIVKYVSSLKNKKYRNKYNKYVVEGIKLAQELMNSGDIFPEFIVYSEELVKMQPSCEQFLKQINTNTNKYNIVEVTKEIFEYLTDTETPQGVLLVLDKKEYTICDLKDISDISQKFIILDKIQDPGNLGSIIRTAIGFGVKNIICMQGTVDCFSPKVIRSTMGAIEKVNIYSISEDEIEEMIKILNSKGYSIVVTSLKAQQNVREVKLDNKVVFVMGNEANGVSSKFLNNADKLIKIPIENTLESFNVSVAYGIVAYEQYIKSSEM